MKKGIVEGKVRIIEGKKARMKGRMVWKGEKEERRNGNGIYTLTRWVGGLTNLALQHDFHKLLA